MGCIETCSPCSTVVYSFADMAGFFAFRRSSSTAGYLDRRRAIGQVHGVGHRDNDLAGSREGFPRVRGADIVHQQQVASLPSLACGVCLVNLVDQLYDVRADRVAVAKASIERQSVLAV